MAVHQPRRGVVRDRAPSPEPIGRMAPRTQHEGCIQLRFGQAQSLLDGVRRAINNVRQSEGICEAAAKAFRSERTALEETETLLEDLLTPDSAHAQASIALAEGALGRR